MVVNNYVNYPHDRKIEANLTAIENYARKRSPEISDNIRSYFIKCRELQLLTLKRLR